MLSSIIKVGSNLPDEEYDKIVIPCIIRMFSTPDRGIRMALLEKLPSYVERLSKKIVNDQIFPHVVSGILRMQLQGLAVVMPISFAGFGFYRWCSYDPRADHQGNIAPCPTGKLNEQHGVSYISQLQSTKATFD